MIHTTPSLEDRAKAVGLYDSRLIDWVIRVEEVIKQRNELLDALEFARDKISELHLEAGDGDCHYAAINDAIASVKGGA